VDHPSYLVFNSQHLRYLDTVGFYFEAPEGKTSLKESAKWAILAAGLLTSGRSTT